MSLLLWRRWHGEAVTDEEKGQRTTIRGKEKLGVGPISLLLPVLLIHRYRGPPSPKGKAKKNSNLTYWLNKNRWIGEAFGSIIAHPRRFVKPESLADKEKSRPATRADRDELRYGGCRIPPGSLRRAALDDGLGHVGQNRVSVLYGGDRGASAAWNLNRAELRSATSCTPLPMVATERKRALNGQLEHGFSSKPSAPNTKTDCLRNPFYFWWRQLESNQ